VSRLVTSKPIWFDRGQLSELPLNKIPPEAFLLGENIYYRAGSWWTRPGHDYYGTKTLNVGTNITGLFSLHQVSHDYLVVTDNRDLAWYDEASDTLSFITPMYTSGTVTFNGTIYAVGSGTQWQLAGIKHSDKIKLNTGSIWYTVDTVVDDTHITLTSTAVAGSGAYIVRKLLTAVPAVYPDWTAFGDYLIITNGTDDTLWWNGETDEVSWADMTTTWAGESRVWTDPYFYGVFSALPNAYKARYCESFMGRLFLFDLTVGGVRYPTMGAWSAYRAITDWTAWDSDTFYLDDTAEGITGTGLCRDFLLVFKRRATFAIAYIGGSTLFEIMKKSNTIGTIAHRTVKSGPNGVFFQAEDGVYWYDMYTFTRVSDPVNSEFLNGLHPGYMHLSFAQIDYERHLYKLYYCTIANTTGIPDKIFVYDYENKICSFWTVPFVDGHGLSAETIHHTSIDITWAQMTHAWEYEGNTWFSKSFVTAANMYVYAQQVTKKLVIQSSQIRDFQTGYLYPTIKTAYVSGDGLDITTIARLALFFGVPKSIFFLTHSRSDDGRTVIIGRETRMGWSSAGDEDPFIDIYEKGRFHIFTFKAIGSVFGVAGYQLEMIVPSANAN